MKYAKALGIAAAFIVASAGIARAQCSGDPTSGNPVIRQAVLTLGQSIPSTAPDAMQRMATALQAQGHAVSVMDNNGPSDHKAWIDGEAWTWRSTDPVRCPTITWSPYLQAGYDGSGFSACGIPTSAHLNCPSGFVAPVPAPAPPPAPAPAPQSQDNIDIHTATIVNGPDVWNWPSTATITSISLDGHNMRVEFTKKNGPDRWPDVRPKGWDGDLQYTVWLFLNVNGQWTGSGFVQMWNGRDGVGDAPSDFSTNWYYGNRWSPMEQHGPIRPGEQIGIMVTSGNARDSGGPYGPAERSNIVTFAATDTGNFVFAAQPASPVPVPQPPPVVTSPVVPPTPPIVVPPSVPAINPDFSAIIAQINALIKIEADTNSQVTQMNRTLGQTLGAVASFTAKYIAPAVMAYYAAKKIG